MGRRAGLRAYRFEEPLLLVFFEVADRYRGLHLHATRIYESKQFWNKIGKADVAPDHILANAQLFSEDIP